MALSLFIKQLLETDSIFGGEAKKLSGINDASVQVNFLGVDVVTTSTPTIETLTITGRAGDAPVPPSWLVVDKYVTVTVESTSISRNRQRVLSVTPFADGFTVNFRPGETGSSTLPDINVTDVNINIDGRIWAIINDENIAREADNGSTMFNVNNSTPTGLPDGSGLVQKYAAHYHSGEDAIGFEIVSHQTNLRGKTITGVDVERAATEQPVQFNRSRASAEYSRFITEGESPPEISLEITTANGIQEAKVFYAPDPGPIVAITGLPNNSANITTGLDGFSLDRHSPLTSPTDTTQWNFGFNNPDNFNASITHTYTTSDPNIGRNDALSTGGNFIIIVRFTNGAGTAIDVSQGAVPPATTLNQLPGLMSTVLNLDSTFSADYIASTITSGNFTSLVITARVAGPDFNTATDGVSFISTLTALPTQTGTLSGGSSDVGIRKINVPLPTPSPTSTSSISNSTYIKAMADSINAVLGASGTDLQDEWIAELSYAPSLLPVSSPIQPAANNLLGSMSNIASLINEFTEITVGPNDANQTFSILVQGVIANPIVANNQYEDTTGLESLLNTNFAASTVTNGLIEAVRIDNDRVNLVEVTTPTRPRGLFNLPVRIQNRASTDVIAVFDKVPAFLVISAPAIETPVSATLVDALSPTQRQQKIDERRIEATAELRPSFSNEFELLELLEQETYFKSVRDDISKLGEIVVNSIPTENSTITLTGSIPITLTASLTSSVGTNFLITGTNTQVANSIRDAINRNSNEIVATTIGNEIRVGVNLENSLFLTGISTSSSSLTIVQVVTNPSILSISSRLIAEGIILNFIETTKIDPTAADIWTDGVGNKLVNVQLGGVRATTYQPAGPDVVFDENGNAVFNLRG